MSEPDRQTPDEEPRDHLGRTAEQARQWRLRGRFTVVLSVVLGTAGYSLPAPLQIALAVFLAAMFLLTAYRAAPGRCDVCGRWTVGLISDSMPTIRWWKVWPLPRAKHHGCPQHWSQIVFAQIHAKNNGPMDDRI